MYKKNFQLKKVFSEKRKIREEKSSLVTLICDEVFPSDAMLMHEKKTFYIFFSSSNLHFLH